MFHYKVSHPAFFFFFNDTSSWLSPCDSYIYTNSENYNL